jgi:hypothetical protein
MRLLHSSRPLLSWKAKFAPTSRSPAEWALGGETILTGVEPVQAISHPLAACRNPSSFQLGCVVHFLLAKPREHGGDKGRKRWQRRNEPSPPPRDSVRLVDGLRGLDQRTLVDCDLSRASAAHGNGSIAFHRAVRWIANGGSPNSRLGKRRGCSRPCRLSTPSVG